MKRMKQKILNLPLIMNYQMSTLEVSSFKKTIANQMGKKESELENVSVEQLGESLGVKLKSFKQEKSKDD